jgi:hypothetical protein
MSNDVFETIRTLRSDYNLQSNNATTARGSARAAERLANTHAEAAAQFKAEAAPTKDPMEWARLIEQAQTNQEHAEDSRNRAARHTANAKQYSAKCRRIHKQIAALRAELGDDIALTMADVVAAARQCIVAEGERPGRERVRRIFADFGAAKITDIKPRDYTAVMKAIRSGG